MTALTKTHKTYAAIILLGIALLFWGYHVAHIRIEFPDSHVDGLLVCSPEYNPAPWESASDASLYTQLEEALGNAVDPDSQVMSVIQRLDLSEDERTIALAELTNQYPENRLANLRFLDACAATFESPACDVGSVEAANAVNDDNAMSWSLLSVYQSKLLNEAGVQSALLRAANAPVFDDHFGSQLRTLRAALAAETDDEVIAQAWTLQGGGRLVLNNINQLSAVCSSGDLLPASLLHACVDVGERMELEGQSLIMAMMGMAIQEIAYSGLGDGAELERVEQKYLEFQRARSAPDSLWNQFNRAASLMSYDVNLATLWMDSLIEFGETEAGIANVVAEARRLSAEPDYQPCRSPGPRISYVP